MGSPTLAASPHSILLVAHLDIDLIRISVEGGNSELIVPVEFFAYRSLGEAVRFSAEAGRSLIRFGTIGTPGPVGVAVSVFVDEDSGEVVSGIEPDDTAPVNASLGMFVECVRCLTEIFPFYSEESDDEEWEAGARRVQETIREIDAAVYQEGSFWYEFRRDVSMGEFHG
ncbi:SUKH-4 family immunity protein [Streptomyces sp. NPDC000983]|uniref:SUKH-4 family immunity protein n=1 Tax=Streptomyces sp. NPDC000983 TaxID=3154373 RepID=UPI0033182E6A